MNAVDRFMRKVNKTSTCWLWTGYCGRTGYGAFGYQGKVMRAHRVSWLLFVGGIANGLSVCHSCDVRNCVNHEHLFLGTHAENMWDAKTKGRLSCKEAIAAQRPEFFRRGSAHHAAKMTEAGVIELRRLRANGWTLKRLAERFDVSWPTVQSIASGATWKHIPMNPTQDV